MEHSGVFDALSAAVPYLHEYEYSLLFTAIFLESFGLPLPGESLLVSAAVLSGSGKMQFAFVVPLAWCAAVLGDNVGYGLGRFAGRAVVLRLGQRVGLQRKHLAAVERFFHKGYGSLVVILARFVVPARQLNGIAAGTALMPWWKFVLCNAAGAALWVAVWCLGGHYVGDHVSGLIRWAEKHTLVTLLCAGGVLGFVLLLRFSRGGGRIQP